MVEKNTEANTDSTPPKDDSIATDSRTEEALLADIVRNSEFVESLPNEQVPEGDTEEATEEDPEVEESDETEEVEEEVETEDEETEAEDDDEESSTEEADVYSQDELDLDAQVVVKIDGKDQSVSFSDLIKGYSTEQSLSNKGRELGDARKSLEVEYEKRFSEIKNMSQASAALLYKDEQDLSKKYHDIEAKIQKARDDGDTYEVGELKDQREQAQKAYWEARRQRESLAQSVGKKAQEEQQKQWDILMKHYQETIPTLIPDYSEKVVKDIRQFALDEGINESIVESMIDPSIVKFVDDYRRLKNGITKGAAKRKTTVVKKVPVKKAKSKNQKQIAKEEVVRRKALTEGASEADQMNFLRQHAERSLGNN